MGRVVPLISARIGRQVQGRGARQDRSRAGDASASEAGGQSRRTYDVVIGDPVKVADVHPLRRRRATSGRDGSWAGVRSVAVGPEGGWAGGEWGDGRRRVGLGPTVLRAETAGVVAARLLAFQAGGWGFTLDGASAMSNDESTR